MKTLELADRYAKAVFELAENQGETETLRHELGILVRIMAERAQILELFQSPLISREEKHALIEGIQPERSSLFERLLMLLVERRRVDLLPTIVSALQDLSDQKKGVAEATIITARPLDSSLMPQLERALERLTGKKVACETKMDPSLIGGIQIHLKNHLIDGTVRRNLNELEARLKLAKV